MARPPRNFDVWFVAANTVYKGVPFQVVADWVSGGRLAETDRVRLAGSNAAWADVAGNELLAAYLPLPEPAHVAADTGEPTIEDLELDEPRPRRRHADEDEDPDMIPLIDISLVLLIFFMMMRAAGALSPVDVPDMQFAGEPSKDALVITIEKKSADEVFYSVRRGENPPAKEHASLPTPESAIAALDSFLATAQEPQDVRIACAKDLPNERVYEIVRELKPRKERNLIGSYDAEVNEKAK